jgi:hypothetical protein
MGNSLCPCFKRKKIEPKFEHDIQINSNDQFPYILNPNKNKQNVKHFDSEIPNYNIGNNDFIYRNIPNVGHDCFECDSTRYKNQIVDLKEQLSKLNRDLIEKNEQNYQLSEFLNLSKKDLEKQQILIQKLKEKKDYLKTKTNSIDLERKLQIFQENNVKLSESLSEKSTHLSKSIEIHKQSEKYFQDELEKKDNELSFFKNKIKSDQILIKTQKKLKKLENQSKEFEETIKTLSRENSILKEKLNPVEIEAEYQIINQDLILEKERLIEYQKRLLIF